jgi:hypothetical protein
MEARLDTMTAGAAQQGVGARYSPMRALKPARSQSRPRIVAVRLRGGTLASHSGERESMRKILISGCLVVLVAACAPSERPKASVELTQGSVEGRKALA